MEIKHESKPIFLESRASDHRVGSEVGGGESTPTPPGVDTGEMVEL